MKVKKFCGFDNHEAMQKVRLDLGPDAVILHQRKIKQKGILGFFKKPIIEIVAAVDEKESRVSLNSRTSSVKRPDEVLKEKVSSSHNNNEKEAVISKEIREIKNMLSTVMQRVNNNQELTVLTCIENEKAKKIYNILKENDIEEDYIHLLIKTIEDLVSKNFIDENQSVEEIFKIIIEKYVIEGLRNINSKLVFFVGPTGVGKTTTIAKLAAHFSLNEGKRVGFISADTYRIAAIEQLKTYSDILNIPVETIYHNNEIHDAIEKLYYNDIIMIDTAGRSHKNLQQVEELKDLLGQTEDKEIYLVISCTSKNKDVKEILETYSFLEDYKIIFTKIDEATSYGTIINAAVKTQKPISYITTGQCVPDDIELISIDRLVKLLIKEEG